MAFNEFQPVLPKSDDPIEMRLKHFKKTQYFVLKHLAFEDDGNFLLDAF